MSWPDFTFREKLRTPCHGLEPAPSRSARAGVAGISRHAPSALAVGDHVPTGKAPQWLSDLRVFHPSEALRSAQDMCHFPATAHSSVSSSRVRAVPAGAATGAWRVLRGLAALPGTEFSPLRAVQEAARPHRPPHSSLSSAGPAGEPTKPPWNRRPFRGEVATATGLWA